LLVGLSLVMNLTYLYRKRRKLSGNEAQKI
jgi:hypothetical protein